MIIRFTGGMGNQMFQYAYGRSRSIRNGEPFKYFFVHYRGDTNRKYELGIFNIKGKKINGIFPNFLVKLSNYFHFNILNIKYGYWQNPKYFSNYEDEIRKDFQFIRPLDRKNLNILKQIENTDSVSVHIRRGDYILDIKNDGFHAVCPPSYCKVAVNYIKERIENPKFFVFSDDPKWVKNNLKIDNTTYIDWNRGDMDYKDMQLMSHCKHNIIANSSFSWWGAWLNQNPNKMVIAPKRWFNAKQAKSEVKDMIPKKWIKL
jgi:hypothetical protein